MMIGVIGLVAVFILLSILLLSLNLFARWQWWIKAVAIVTTCAFFAVAYLSIEALLGWPTEQIVPARHVLHWAHIVEPDRRTDNPGAIYLWLEAVDDADETTGVPRAYALPYSRELHKKVTDAKKRIGKGRRQRGQVQAQGPEEQGRPGSRNRAPRIEFHDLPPPLPPVKEASATEAGHTALR